MGNRNQIGLVALALAVALAVASAARADYLTIYGGPTYNSSTGTGYPSAYLGESPLSSAASGVGAAAADTYTAGVSKGVRAVRWDSSGTVIELGILGTNGSGTTNSYGYAVNDAMTSVGYADRYDAGVLKGSRAVRWNAAGTAVELGNLGTDGSGTTNTFAIDVNSSGTSVGYAARYDAGSYKGDRAVRWDSSGTVATELASLGPVGTNSIAFVVNDAGTAVGYSDKGATGWRAVRWDATGTAATELGTLGTATGGITFSRAYDVNSSGTAVGYAYQYEAGNFVGARAVRWNGSGTAATELGILGTSSLDSTQSEARAVNDAGTAVGYANKYVEEDFRGARAVRWDSSGTAATELGDLGTDVNGDATSRAYDINNAGIAVGSAQEYDGFGSLLGTSAVMWGLDGVAIKLDSLIDPASGWTSLSLARNISDDNWITGKGTFDPDGSGGLAAYSRLFLLQISTTSSLSGDFDDDGDVDAADIDILWHIVRVTGTDPNNNDSADLNGDTLVNEDDVDTMLASKLSAGPNRAYGDANLSGGTPELTDFNLWRTGTGGWAAGDFDGSGGTPELNDYNLWRTGPTVFPSTVGSHGGGAPGGGLVPEPATIVLMGLALPAFILFARRRKWRQVLK